jgi:hypothetical protein
MTAGLTVGSGGSPTDLDDREFAADRSIQLANEVEKFLALYLWDDQLHDGRRVEIRNLHRRSSRRASSASEPLVVTSPAGAE